MAARELDQADFDLDRFVDLFDEAMTSKDPRVIETLRSLMMIVALTRPEAGTKHSSRDGPLRRLFEDMHNLNRRVNRMEEETSSRQQHYEQARNWPASTDKYALTDAYNKELLSDWAAKVNVVKSNNAQVPPKDRKWK